MFLGQILEKMGRKWSIFLEHINPFPGTGYGQNTGHMRSRLKSITATWLLIFLDFWFSKQLVGQIS